MQGTHKVLVAHSPLAIFGVAIRRVCMLTQTLTNTLRLWPLLVLLFLLTLLPALPATLAFCSTLTSEADRSLAPLALLPGFNYTVFTDFMHEHGNAVWPLVRTGWWTALLSVLLSVWVKGGILYSFTNGFSAVTFWQSATHYFSRNLRLLGVTVLFVLLWLLVLIAVGLLISTLLEEALDDPFTERGYVAIGALVLLLFGLALARILCTSQYASVLMYYGDEQTAFRAYSQSWRFIGQHWRGTFGRYLLLILIGTGLWGVYFIAESVFQAHNWLLIAVLLLLQQAFVFSRVVLNVWALRIAVANTQALPQPPARSMSRSAPAHQEPIYDPSTSADSADDIPPIAN